MSDSVLPQVREQYEALPYPPRDPDEERRRLLPTWLAVGGFVSAGLIATGVVIPVIEPASLTNFAGYVVWCAWLIAVAVVLFQAGRRR